MTDTIGTPAPLTPSPMPLGVKPALTPTYEQGDQAATRAYTLAEDMLRGGHEPERVKAALAAEGFDPALLDERTPAQVKHDKEFGIDHRIDGSALFFDIPPGTVTDAAALNSDLRSLTTDLALSRDAGSSFAKSIVRAIAAQTAEPDLRAAATRHEQSVRQIYGDKYPEKAAAIVKMLDERCSGIANKQFVAALKPDGVVGSRPEVFVALSNRAAKLALWKSTRPEKK